MKFRLGVLVNPYAGIGGSLALKGSDGDMIRNQALALGAELKAPERMRQALEPLIDADIQIITWGGPMGEEVVKTLGFSYDLLGQPASDPSSAQDTMSAARAMSLAGVDLLLFAGGDGTARDLCQAVGEQLPVLGVPAGVKIHSGVYTLTPVTAGLIVNDLIAGRLVGLKSAEVRDIDEDAFRTGRVRAKYFGELLVPAEHQYIQSVKQSGVEVEALVLDDIAAGFEEQMEAGCFYLMGSGSTVAAIMEHLGHENTLLGVDLIKDGDLIAKDCTASELLELIKDQPVRVVLTPIGGQGHLIGRGNQQISAGLLAGLTLDDFYVVGTRTKIKALDGRPLIIDSGDKLVDQKLAGLVAVHTGYRDAILYRVGLPDRH